MYLFFKSIKILEINLRYYTIILYIYTLENKIEEIYNI